MGVDLSGKKIIAYGPYTLPRGKIRHPRPDAAKDLLALRELKEPIKTGLADIDALNAELFKATKEKGKTIQVLTNRPQTVFYVAATVRARRVGITTSSGPTAKRPAWASAVPDGPLRAALPERLRAAVS